MNDTNGLRILLVGANGQLGHALSRALLTLGQVRALTREQADLSDPSLFQNQLRSACEDFVPTIIVNAAAYTAVDKAESSPDSAMAVNATAVGVMGAWAHELGALMVHYSTDYVFDGHGTHAWQENDLAHPLSVYGTSKLLGEQALAKVNPRHLILRTSWVVGTHGGNFLKTMLRLAQERDALRVVSDQVGVPTSADLLAQVTVQLLQAMHEAEGQDPRWGIYHVAASGETTWHAYAQHVIAGAIQRGMVLKCTPEQVAPITTEDYPTPAQRPLNSRLDTDRIVRTFGVRLPPWQAGVDAILDQLIQPSTAS